MRINHDDMQDAKVRVLSPAKPKAVAIDAHAEEMRKLVGILAEALKKPDATPEINVNPEIINTTPTSWKITVTARDGDRRIKEMTIRAM